MLDRVLANKIANDLLSEVLIHLERLTTASSGLSGRLYRRTRHLGGFAATGPSSAFCGFLRDSWDLDGVIGVGPVLQKLLVADRGICRAEGLIGQILLVPHRKSIQLALGWRTLANGDRFVWRLPTGWSGSLTRLNDGLRIKNSVSRA